MNMAVPVFEATGSGVDTGGGICAGTVTENVAWNVLPFSNIGLPLSVLTLVWFVGWSVTDTVPMPGTVYGGDMYGIGAWNEGGSSSPTRQTAIPLTLLNPLATSAAGGISGGDTVGGINVICSMSPFRMM
jgi:hypothetical protein